MAAAVDNNEDIGFDIKRAKLRLVAWLVQHGVVDPEVKELVAARRMLLTAKSRLFTLISAYQKKRLSI